MVEAGNLRHDIKEYMARTGASQNKVAAALGISGGALSAWINDAYTGNNGQINSKISAFLDRQRDKGTMAKFATRFVETSVSRNVWKIAKLAHLEGEICVCTGDAGLGKTLAVQEYSKRDTSVILVETDLGYTAKVLFGELHKRLIGGGHGLIHDMFEALVEKLKDSERLLIIDEAEHLPYRALELLRRLHDKTGIGILLIGMPRLIENIRGRRGEFAQLYSRVGGYLKLDKISADDAAIIVSEHIESPNDRSTAAFYEACRKNTRVLGKLIRRTLRVAKHTGEQISDAMIKQTAEMLLV